MPSFRDALAEGPIVFDGATGSMLYERGIYLNKCFDELCLSQPALVEEVHRDYVAVGVDVIQTNTYGANRMALGRHGLADRVGDVCRAAADIARRAAEGRAWVAGSVGPTGLLAKDLIRNRTRREAFDAFHEQVSALSSAGVDALVFETFGHLGELEIAVEAAYDVAQPIVAQVSFDEGGLTLDGATVEEALERLRDLDVEVIGANCVLGPERLLQIVERMVDGPTPVSMQPNAGFPRTVDGRAIYQASPETFGVIARRAFKRGVRIVGGCCGTTPAHLRRVVAAARMVGGGRWHARAESVEVQAPQGPPAAVVPLAERSRFGQGIAEGRFVTSVELSPPTGLDPSRVLDRVRALEAAGVDVVNIPDGPRATVRMSNLAFAQLVRRETSVEPLVHVCARDRNLLALQADLLGAHTLGVRNLVLITGDPPKVGDYPDATAVFDLDSIGLLDLAAGLNAGRDPAGKAIAGSTSFVLATGAEPAAADLEREVQRLADKKAAGAELVMTQPVYDPAVLDRFLDRIAPLELPVLVGILPLASTRNAEFLHKNVPGMRVPEAVRERMRRAGDGGRAEGIAIAVEALQSVKDRVQGTYLMPPFGRVEAAIEILEAL